MWLLQSLFIINFPSVSRIPERHLIVARPSLQAACGKRSSLATKGQIKVETIVKEKYRVSQKNALSDLPSISRKLSIPDHQINWWLEMLASLKVRFFWDTLYEKTAPRAA